MSREFLFSITMPLDYPILRWESNSKRSI